MQTCTKMARFGGMIFGTAAIILLLLGIIGYIIWLINGGDLFNVANFWNYFYLSVPFSLVAIVCMMFVVAGRGKEG